MNTTADPANQHIGDIIENVLKPLYQKVDGQNMKDATLFRHGKITQKEYERRCCWRGCEPVGIEGFYKWDGGGTSELPDWNAGLTG